MRTTARGNILRLVADNGTPPGIHVEHVGTEEVADGVARMSFAISVTHAEPLTTSEIVRVEQIALHYGRVITILGSSNATTTCPPGMPKLIDDICLLIRRAVRIVIGERN